MLKAVIFDMDGVIIDSHPAHREAWKTFLATVGRPVSDAELDFVLDGRKRGEILRHFLGELSDDEVRGFGERKDEFFQRQALQVRPIAGAIDLICKLADAGIATAVATSASESRARHVLEQLLLDDKFRVVVTGNDVSKGKPDPSIYRLACQRLKVLPAHTLAIEDAMSGVEAAVCAGLTCVGIGGHQTPEKLRAAGATHVLENFIDVSPASLESLLRWRPDGPLLQSQLQT
jgi:HAD superfamily hydrolase (TIGR01509 family)